MAPTNDTGSPLSEYVEPRFDGGPGPRAKIGLIALVHDLGFEPEFLRFSQCEGVAVYANRIEMDHDTTPRSLRDMLPRIEAVTRGLAQLGALEVGQPVGVVKDEPLREAPRFKDRQPLLQAVTEEGEAEVIVHGCVEPLDYPSGGFVGLLDGASCESPAVASHDGLCPGGGVEV